MTRPIVTHVSFSDLHDDLGFDHDDITTGFGVAGREVGHVQPSLLPLDGFWESRTDVAAKVFPRQRIQRPTIHPVWFCALRFRKSLPSC